MDEHYNRKYTAMNISPIVDCGAVPKVSDTFPALPCKMVHTLSHKLGLRAWIHPESTLSAWNDTKNGVRRAHKQHCFLLPTILSNMGHGPFSGGKNKQSLNEATRDFAESLEPLSSRSSCHRCLKICRLSPATKAFPEEPATSPTCLR